MKCYYKPDGGSWTKGCIESDSPGFYILVRDQEPFYCILVEEGSLWAHDSEFLSLYGDLRGEGLYEFGGGPGWSWGDGRKVSFDISPGWNEPTTDPAAEFKRKVEFCLEHQ